MSATSHFDLSGKVAIVTGGTRGIGRAITKGLAKNGADVVPSSRTAEDVHAAAELVRDQGSDTIEVKADISDPEDVQALIEQTKTELGGIDIVVNNAGINPDNALGRPEDVTPEAYDQTININLEAAFRVCQTAAEELHNATGGTVINIASIGGVVGLPRQHPYVASKHGLVGLTKSIALDWAPEVRVNAVAPGYVETELVEDLQQNEKLRKSIERRTPLNRFAVPDEISGPVVFLASDAATFVTGEILSVDGGWTAR